ncbi:hypothetical protein ACWJJH_19155 [Endozoicomonadaceae bacterium StTr2]
MRNYICSASRLFLFLTLSLFLLIIARVSQSDVLQLPQGLRFAYQIQPDFNGDRPIVGQFGSIMIINASLTGESGYDGKGRSFPVIIDTDPNVNKYALVVQGFPLKWLKIDQPVEGNLDDEELAQIQSSSTYVYYHSGLGVISGMYAQQPQDNKNSDDSFCAAFIYDLKNALSESAKRVSYSFLPGASGPTAQSLACAWRVSVDGNIAFGFEFVGSTDCRCVDGLPVSMSLNKKKIILPKGYSESSRAKKYLFWLKQADDTYKSVVVDFSGDDDTDQLLVSGDASLLINASSDDVTTIAVNRVRTDEDSPDSVYVMGLIKLEASSGSTTWHRLPSSGTSQSIAMTSDGANVLVVYDGLYLYKLPYSVVNQLFSKSVAEQYQLPGETKNYLLDKILGDDADPASSGFGIQHFNGVQDSVFKGMLVSRYRSAMGYDDGNRVFAYPQICSLLTLKQNQLAGDSDIPLSASQPAFTLGLENDQSQHVYYAAKDVRDGGDITTYYMAILPAIPELPPYSPPERASGTTVFMFVSPGYTEHPHCVIRPEGKVPSTDSRTVLQRTLHQDNRRRRFHVPQWLKCCITPQTN